MSRGITRESTGTADIRGMDPPRRMDLVNQLRGWAVAHEGSGA